MKTTYFFHAPDDLIINVSNPHHQQGIYIKDAAHDAANDVKTNIGAGMSYVSTVVHRWPAHVPAIQSRQAKQNLLTLIMIDHTYTLLRLIGLC